MVVMAIKKTLCGAGCGGCVVLALLLLAAAVTVLTPWRAGGGWRGSLALHQSYSNRVFLARLDGPLLYDDPSLLATVRAKFLHPPSTGPYNLNADKDDFRSSSYNSHIHVDESYLELRLFEDVRGGFFVEAGAVDGEFLSNTLQLEREQGWRGLLVEADRAMYQKLLPRGRRAWSSPVCLATHPYPHQEVFISYSQANTNDDLYLYMYARGHGVLASHEHLSPAVITNAYVRDGAPVYDKVQCLPLATLLLALDTTNVTFVSLDLEGAESAVLATFPFEAITVDVWLIEYYNNTATHARQQDGTPGSQIQSLADLASFFSTRGFDLYHINRIQDNYFFVRRGSRYHTVLGLD